VGGTLCIGNTCLTEDDFKKVKNNTFPGLNVDGTLAIRKRDSPNYATLLNQGTADLKITSTYDGNAYITLIMGGDPYIDIKGNRALTTGRNLTNIWTDSSGYLHNNGGFAQKNPASISQ